MLFPRRYLLQLLSLSTSGEGAVAQAGEENVKVLCNLALATATQVREVSHQIHCFVFLRQELSNRIVQLWRLSKVPDENPFLDTGLV